MISRGLFWILFPLVLAFGIGFGVIFETLLLAPGLPATTTQSCTTSPNIQIHHTSADNWIVAIDCR